MSERARTYRFTTGAHWRTCLIHGFDPSGPGGLQPVARLGSRARPFTMTGPVTLVAADLSGGPIWRVSSADAPLLFRRTDIDESSGPTTIEGTLARASRWAVDRQWLWAFDGGAGIVRRFERDALQEDVAVDLGADDEVRDIASDGRSGAWALVRDRGGRWWLQHFDCDARPAERFGIPADVAGPLQIGVIGRGARIVLLGRSERLYLFDAGDGHLIRSILNWRDDPCWRADRLTTDNVNRIGVLCHYSGDPERWAVFLLDAEGDPLDLVTGPQERLKHRPHDIAIAAGVLWLGADDGLWMLDSSEVSVTRESESVLLTPALLSPETSSGTGWLRAEIDADLPRGAVIEAEAVSTSDVRIFNEANRIAADLSRSAEGRREAIRALFDRRTTRTFHLTEAPGRGQPLAVPLFGSAGRWLWLQLRLVTPPGVTPPALRELRVLHPDASLTRNMPGAFRGSDNDPTGFLRSLVGVLETTTQGIDARIRSIASHIDPSTAPPAWLDYTARWLDLPWDNALPEAAKRRLARDAGALLELRGTRRGLERLLRALAGPRARVRLLDMTVDHAPARLGGRGCGLGPRLPMLLAGPSPAAPILSRAVIGRACLGVPCDPMRTLAPTIVIQMATTRAVRAIGPLIERIVAQYVPVGVRVSLAWTIVSDLIAVDPEDGDVLDGHGPGHLGTDSELGRVVLGGRRGTIDDAGLDVEFPLS